MVGGVLDCSTNQRKLRIMKIERVVIWFSAGITSAVAAKIATIEYYNVHPVHLVNTDTGSEDIDNYRFMDDVSKWVGVNLEVIRNEKFNNTFEVYDKFKFFKNRYGARCTLELKKNVRRNYENLETDLQIFGYSSDEEKRAQLFCENNPEVNTYFPLIEHGITKEMCREVIFKQGISEPRTYGLGFKNANCLAFGCVKGGMGYWNHIREVFPDVFWKMAEKERELSFSINAKEKVENGRRVKIPIFLDQLDKSDGNYKFEKEIQCGLFCQDYSL